MSEVAEERKQLDVIGKKLFHSLTQASADESKYIRDAMSLLNDRVTQRLRAGIFSIKNSPKMDNR